jgi:hypothetical protein
MFCSGHRLRSWFLGLALLLAGLANFVSISYDADEQDEIPPVTVELKFVVRAAVRAHSVQLISAATTHFDTGAVRSQMPVIAKSSDAASAVFDLPNSSPQRLTPLLC